MSYKKSHLSILFLFLVFFSNCQENILLNKKEIQYLSQNKNLNVAIYINYPPYQFINSNGNIEGILLDFLNVLENKLDYKFKRKYYHNWQNLIKDAEANKLDVILEIQKTDDREKYLNFTDPIFIGNHVIITKNNSPLNSIKDLQNKTVAVVDEYPIEEHLTKNHPKLNLVTYRNETDGLNAVSNGEIDAFIALKSSLNYFIKKEDIKNLSFKESIDFKNELGIAITKQKLLLTKIIKKATNDISLEDKKEITDKWLSDIVKPYHKSTSFWELLVLIILSVLVISFLLNYYLKQLVKKRTKALEKATHIAEKNNQLKTSFLQNISHEIRTPLNSILSYSDFIDDEKTSETDKKKYLKTIREESYNLKTVLNNVVEIANINTKKTSQKSTNFNLNDELNVIVEDMKLNYLVLCKILQDAIVTKKTIHWAVNGKDAVNIVNKQNIDIIFMDIKMPIMDGFEATKIIRQSHPDIPIFAQSAYANENDYNKALSLGFSDYLTKPINKSAVKIALKNLYII